MITDKEKTVELMVKNQKLYEKNFDESEASQKKDFSKYLIKEKIIENMVENVWKQSRIYEWIHVQPMLTPTGSIKIEENKNYLVHAKARMLRTVIGDFRPCSEIEQKVILENLEASINLEIEAEVCKDLIECADKQEIQFGSIFKYPQGYINTEDFDWVIAHESMIKFIQPKENFSIYTGHTFFPENIFLLGKNISKGYFYCPFISITLLERENENNHQSCGIMMRYDKRYINFDQACPYKCLKIKDN